MYTNGATSTELAPVRTPHALPCAYLQEVSEEHLHTWWPLLHEGLLDVIEKTQPEWWPEDVYGELRAGRASAYLVMPTTPPGPPVGFFIVCTQSVRWTPKKELFIWAGWALPPQRMVERGFSHAESLAFQRQGMEVLEQYARTQGISKLVYLSPREGMTRLAGQLGFTPSVVRYERGVESG